LYKRCSDDSHDRSRPHVRSALQQYETFEMDCIGFIQLIPSWVLDYGVEGAGREMALTNFLQRWGNELNEKMQEVYSETPLCLAERHRTNPSHSKTVTTV
jgi:hypothetical protein